MKTIALFDNDNFIGIEHIWDGEPDFIHKFEPKVEGDSMPEEYHKAAPKKITYVRTELKITVYKREQQ